MHKAMDDAIAICLLSLMAEIYILWVASFFVGALFALRCIDAIKQSMIHIGSNGNKYANIFV